MATQMARVQVDGSLFMVAVPSTQKLRQNDDGSVSEVFNSVTAEAVMVITLTEVFEGRAQVLKISVPASQVPESAVPGTVVRPVGLVCSPWGMPGFNGQVNTGLSYRAERIELVAAPAAALAGASAGSSAGESRGKGAEAQK